MALFVRKGGSRHAGQAALPQRNIQLNMRNPIFDYDDGDFIYHTSGNMGIDSDGDLHMRMGDNMSMDMDTGELHFNSGWRNDDEDDDF